MSFRQKCRNILLVGLIALALLTGVPVRPDQMEELLASVNRPKIAHVLRQEKEDAEPD